MGTRDWSPLRPQTAKDKEMIVMDHLFKYSDESRTAAALQVNEILQIQRDKKMVVSVVLDRMSSVLNSLSREYETVVRDVLPGEREGRVRRRRRGRGNAQDAR